MIHILRNSWPSVLDEFLKSEALPKFTDSTVYQRAAVNILEQEDGFQIEVVVPGFEKKDISVNLDNRVLTISSATEAEGEEKEQKYLRREFQVASFKRSFTLPETADTDKISAEHNNGVLYLNIPKKEEAKVKAPRLIEVA